jgi:ADP-heptose:LPS heptosyltransferase
MIHPGSLGDVLLAVHALIRLRARFPNHRLVLCAENQAARLLLACGVIDAWAPVQGLACAGLFVGMDPPSGQVQRWLEHCDLAVAWMKDQDGKLAGTLKAIGARKVIVRSPFSAVIHATHQRDRFLEAINEAPSDRLPGGLLPVTEPLYQLGRACLEAAGLPIGQLLIVIHPGSGSAHKCVAPETLTSIVNNIEGFGAIPVLLEGPADQEPVERVLQLCASQPIVLKGLDILTVAGVLAQAHLFVGQDSGVTHLAALLGVRTVALFGPTDSDRWGPSGPDVTVVKGATCLCQSWDEVSRCREKPCLEIAQDHVLALCLAHLRGTVTERVSKPASCH